MTQTCSSCRSCVLSEHEGSGVCRRFPPHLFREVEIIKSTAETESGVLRLHSNYAYVGLADPGCDEYRPQHGPQHGPIGRALARAWRFVVSL